MFHFSLLLLKASCHRVKRHLTYALENTACFWLLFPRPTPTRATGPAHRLCAYAAGHCPPAKPL